MPYNTSPYYPTATGGINFAPSNYQAVVPVMQQPQQPQQQPQQQSGSLTIMDSSEEEMLNYPVAAGVTVLLISFNLGKFWLKSTNTNGVPQVPRAFDFTEKVAAQVAPQTQTTGVSREEFNQLSEQVKKLIEELGGTK